MIWSCARCVAKQWPSSDWPDARPSITTLGTWTWMRLTKRPCSPCCNGSKHVSQELKACLANTRMVIPEWLFEHPDFLAEWSQAVESWSESRAQGLEALGEFADMTASMAHMFLQHRLLEARSDHHRLGIVRPSLGNPGYRIIWARGSRPQKSCRKAGDEPDQNYSYRDAEDVTLLGQRLGEAGRRSRRQCPR